MLVLLCLASPVAAGCSTTETTMSAGTVPVATPAEIEQAARTYRECMTAHGGAAVATLPERVDRDVEPHVAMPAKQRAAAAACRSKRPPPQFTQEQLDAQRAAATAYFDCLAETGVKPPTIGESGTLPDVDPATRRAMTACSAQGQTADRS